MSKNAVKTDEIIPIEMNLLPHMDIPVTFIYVKDESRILSLTLIFSISQISRDYSTDNCKMYLLLTFVLTST